MDFRVELCETPDGRPVVETELDAIESNNMEDQKTDFDRYLERKLQDADSRARFEAADRAREIALQLATLRRARGLTQKQVAELLGTKQQAIARLEDPAYTGHSLSMVRKYVEALGARLDVTIVPAEASSAYAAQNSPKPLLVHEKMGYDSESGDLRSDGLNE